MNTIRDSIENALAKIVLLLALACLAKVNLFAGINDGLIGYWPFNEGSGTVILDQSGSGFNGTIQGNPQRTSGVSGNALSFDGIDDFAVITHNGALNFDIRTSDYSLCFWLKANKRTGEQTILQDRYNGSSGSVSYNFTRYPGDANKALNSNTYFSDISSSAKNYQIGSSFDNVYGEWHFYVVTYSVASGKKIYVDGQLVASVAPPGVFGDSKNSTNAVTVAAGNYDIGTQNFYGGGMDELRIYNRSLSLSEVGMLYNLNEPQSPLVQYKLDGDTRNSASGFLNASAYGGGFTADRFGNPNRAYLFNGIDNYMICDDSAKKITFDARSDNYTVSCWVRLDGKDNNMSFLNDRASGANVHTSFELSYRKFDNGVLYDTFLAQMWDGSRGCMVMGTTHPQIGRWYHLALTVKNRKMTLYVNGISESRPDTPYGNPSEVYSDYGDTRNNEVARTIGCYTGQITFREFLKGALDDIYIFDRALNTAEIVALKQSSVSVDPGIGLVAHFPFDGDANDRTSNALNASAHSVTYGTDRVGGTNKACAFNGTDAYLDIPDPLNKLSFDARSQNYSISSWVYLNSVNTPDDQVLLLGRNNATSPYPYYLVYSRYMNRFMWQTWDGNGSPGVVGVSNATAPQAGTWYHLVLTMENGRQRLFINGVDETTPLYNGGQIPNGYGNTQNSDGVRNIGRYAGAPPNLFNGKLDDLKIYNKALSPAEVADAYGAPVTVPDRYEQQVSLTAASVVGGSTIYPYNAGGTVPTENGQPIYPYNLTGSNNFAATHVVDQQTRAVSESSTTNFWLSPDATTNGYFVLDLGAPTAISKIELFNTHNNTQNDRGTGQFQIEASNTLSFVDNFRGYDLSAASIISLGNLPVTTDPIAAATYYVNGNTVSSSTTYRYIKFTSLSYSGLGSGLAEIRVHEYKTPNPNISINSVTYTWTDANTLSISAVVENTGSSPAQVWFGASLVNGDAYYSNPDNDAQKTIAPGISTITRTFSYSNAKNGTTPIVDGLSYDLAVRLWSVRNADLTMSGPATPLITESQVTSQRPALTIWPGDGHVFGGAMPLVINGAPIDANTKIYYTLNGNEPTPSDYNYRGHTLLVVDRSGYVNTGGNTDVIQIPSSTLSADGILNFKAVVYNGSTRISQTTNATFTSIVRQDPRPLGRDICAQYSSTSKLGSGAAAVNANAVSVIRLDGKRVFDIDIPGNGSVDPINNQVSPRQITQDMFLGFGLKNVNKDYVIVIEQRRAEGDVFAWGVIDDRTEIGSAPDIIDFQSIRVRINPDDYANLFSPVDSNVKCEVRVIKFQEFRNRLLLGATGTTPPDLSTTRNLIVVTHGWNNPPLVVGWEGGGNAFFGDADAEKNLGEIINGLETRRSLYGLEDTVLSRYDWSSDAAVGPAWDNVTAIQLAAGGFRAAESGYIHGINLGKEIVRLSGARAMRIQLIGHSAGTWVCTAAAYYIKKYIPDAQISITLLDGFLPSETREASQYNGNQTDGVRSSLGKSFNSNVSGKDVIKDMPDILGVSVFSFFSTDTFTGTGTQVILWPDSANWESNWQQFANVPASGVDILSAYWAPNKYWRPTNGIQGLVNYDGHGGPVKFYNVSIAAPEIESDGWLRSGLRSVNRLKIRNSIYFDGPASTYIYGDPSIKLVAKASSGLPVQLSVDGPASYDGQNLTFNGAGQVTITASQAGDADYEAAVPLTRVLTVEKAVATVSIANTAHVYDGNPKAATYLTTPSGLNVILTYNGSSSVPAQAGAYALLANIDNVNYIGSVTGTLTIAKGTQTITFNKPNNAYFGAPAISVAATANSGLPVSIAVVDGNCSLAGNLLSYTSTGVMTLTTTQAGDSNWEAATPVTRTISILPSYYSWRLNNGSPLVKNAPMEDANGDGVSNLLAYGLGLDADAVATNTQGLTPGLPVVQATADKLAIEFVKDLDRTDVVVTAEMSSDLQTWTEVPYSVVNTSGTRQQCHAETPLGTGPKKFLRVKVTQAFVAP